MENTMEDIIKKIDSPTKCEIFAKNCIEKGRMDLALKAKERAVQLRAESHEVESDVELEALKAVYAYEETLKTKNGKRTSATRTWQMINRHGIIAAVERAVSRTKQTQGFRSLIALGLEEYAFENVVLKYPNYFSDKAISISSERIHNWKHESTI